MGRTDFYHTKEEWYGPFYLGLPPIKQTSKKEAVSDRKDLMSSGKSGGLPDATLLDLNMGNYHIELDLLAQEMM